MAERSPVKSSPTGGGSKVSSDVAPGPPLPSFADFFVADENLRTVGDPPIPTGARRAGLGRGVPCRSSELAEAVQRLAAAGLTRLKIAQELGIGVSTLYANFLNELGGCPRRPGRRRVEPSDADRAHITAMRAAGATQMAIAEALGVSEPTLRLIYSDELGSNSKTGRRRAKRDATKIGGRYGRKA